MTWNKNIEIKINEKFIIKKEILEVFKVFCKKEFYYDKKDMYSNIENKVNNNIFLNDFNKKDKEYLKLIIALLKFKNLEFNKSNIEYLLNNDRLSSPPQIIISYNESQVYILKKACNYLNIIKDEGNFTWIEVLNDLSIVIASEYFISKEFNDEVKSSRLKITKLLEMYEKNEENEKEYIVDISIMPLLNTDLILKLPAYGKKLVVELISQNIIHPGMFVSQGDGIISETLLEYLMKRPLENAMWFIEKAIINGDEWIDYLEMLKYFNDFYNQFYKSKLGVNFKIPKINFEYNLSLIEKKVLKSKIDETCESFIYWGDNTFDGENSLFFKL